ncbi:hypothetical protein M3Y97_00331400 [Aphelenchoides bicaudatus]|nr:hypothetical protein M3Y97_00331400 [Aphelenchoides bicaudatus]
MAKIVVKRMQYIHTNDTEPLHLEELDNYMYIPFIMFVFGAPLIFIALICYIQHRNRRLQTSEIERITNRRLSV